MSLFSRPSRHSAKKRSTTCEGPVKNSGEMMSSSEVGVSRPTDHAHCQSARTTITETPPRICASYFW